MKFFNWSLEKAIEETIWHIIILSLFSAFAFLSSWIVAGIIFRIFNAFAEFQFPATIAFCSVATLVSLYFFRKTSRFYPLFPRLDFDFQILKKEISLEYLNAHQLIYTKKMTIKALKKGITAYHDKYHWTGSGNEMVRCIIPGQVFQKTVVKNIWQFYVIWLQKALLKNESIETELVWQLDDTAKKTVPFISGTIEEPTDFLTLSITSTNKFWHN